MSTQHWTAEDMDTYEMWDDKQRQRYWQAVHPADPISPLEYAHETSGDY